MQPEVVSLMQQLVTAVQSIALSVDVMSMDLRALNSSVAQIVKREMSPLALAPVCTYSQDDASSPILTTSTPEKLSGMEGATSYQPSEFHDDEDESPQRSSTVRDILREDIKKALGTSSVMGYWDKKHDGPSTTKEVAGSTENWKQCTKMGETEQLSKGVVEGQEESSQSGGHSGLSQLSHGLYENPEAEVHKNESETTEGDSGLQSRVYLNPELVVHKKESDSGEGHSGLSRLQLSSDVYLNPEAGIHKKEGLFKCVWCGREFSDNYKLRRHWRVHTGEKPFHCLECGKSFAHKENLIVHKRNHTGERPFKCVICGKAFAKRDRLMVHGRVHSGEKPYCCQVCGKAFKDNYKLKKHQRLHLPQMMST